MAFVWKMTKETIELPLGCLQGGAMCSKGMVTCLQWLARLSHCRPASPLLLFKFRCFMGIQ